MPIDFAGQRTKNRLMKTLPGWGFSIFIFLITLSFVAQAADSNPPPRLTAELRDGSRVVGDCLEKDFHFHSTLLGEIKLEPQDICSVECVATNSAKLTTAKGDTLTVTFVEPTLAVKTGFGKVNLAVDSLRKLTVSGGRSSGAHPAGLVALWSGENDGKDSINGHDAQLNNVKFVSGKIGQAFLMSDFGSFAKISANPDLDVGKGSGFTICAWIKPSSTETERPIVEWNSGTGFGAHFWISVDRYGAGCLYANLTDLNGTERIVSSRPGIIAADTFQHVAVTYDRNSGLAALYLNGLPVGKSQLGEFTPQTSYDLYLGARVSQENYWWSGALDEISLYNRALSESEIKDESQNGN